MVVLKAWEKGEWGVVLNGYRSSVWKNKKIVGMKGSDSCTIVLVYIELHY